MQFVQEDVRALLLDYRIVDPYLVLWHELINVIMSPFCEVDIEYTAYETSVHNPYCETILQSFPHSLVDIAAIGEFLPVTG